MTSTLRSEIHEIPARAADLIGKASSIFDKIRDQYLQCAPQTFYTLARGSSDAAATVGQYYLNQSTGKLVTSLNPSFLSNDNTSLELPRSWLIAISQSGASPDLINAVHQFRENAPAGSMVLCITNSENSPLAKASDFVVPVMAGPEVSIAATKSVTNTILAMGLLGLWCRTACPNDLATALTQVKTLLEAAQKHKMEIACDQNAVDAVNAFVIGRKQSFGIAQEVALKLKETSGLMAEAFSSAEVMHGPKALVRTGFPVFSFAPYPETSNALSTAHINTEEHLVSLGASLIQCPLTKTDDFDIIDADFSTLVFQIAQLTSFYNGLIDFSLKRGNDPDKPSNLLKITQTV